MGRNGSDKRDLFDSILDFRDRTSAGRETIDLLRGVFRVASSGSAIGGGADKTSTVGLRGPLNRVAPLKRRKERGKEAWGLRVRPVRVRFPTAISRRKSKPRGGLSPA